MKNLTMILWIAIAATVGVKVSKRIIHKVDAVQSQHFAAMDKAMDVVE